MAKADRNVKLTGTTKFQTEFENGSRFVRADEIDADLDTIFEAWNTGLPPALDTAPGTDPAGGDLDGSYPNPIIRAGAVTADKLAAGVVPPEMPPSGPAGGDLAGVYPDPTLTPVAKSKWTTGATTITPTDATKTVALAPVANPMQWGISSAKSRLITTGLTHRWTLNAKADDTPDDSNLSAIRATLEVSGINGVENLTIARSVRGSSLTWTPRLILDGTGKLTIGADPIDPLDVTTKQYVDARSASGLLQEFTNKLDIPVTGIADYPFPAMLAGSLQVGKGYHFMVQGSAVRAGQYSLAFTARAGGASLGAFPSIALGTAGAVWSIDSYFYIVDATTVWVNTRTRSGTTSPTENIVQSTVTMTDITLGIEMIVSATQVTNHAANALTRLRSVVFAA